MARKSKEVTIDRSLVIRKIVDTDPATWQKGKAVARNTLIEDGMTVGEYLDAECEGFTPVQRESHLLFTESRKRIELVPAEATEADVHADSEEIDENTAAELAA